MLRLQVSASSCVYRTNTDMHAVFLFLLHTILYAARNICFTSRQGHFKYNAQFALTCAAVVVVGGWYVVYVYCRHYSCLHTTVRTRSVDIGIYRYIVYSIYYRAAN